VSRLSVKRKVNSGTNNPQIFDDSEFDFKSCLKTFLFNNYSTCDSPPSRSEALQTALYKFDYY